MVSRSGRYVIAYNGEVYNHLDLRKDLDGPWRGGSDTETLLAAIEAWGIERTLVNAVGMFAIALWDRAEQTLILARDRVGEKPLYYGWQEGTFYFASELKAIKAHPAFNARLSREALSLYMRHSYIPAPYSIYDGIRKLEPGHWLTVKREGHSANLHTYWSIQDVAQSGCAAPFVGDAREALQLFDDQLSLAVRRQMIADVPLGALLSGGVDSSAVVTAMQKCSVDPVKTFTIGFREKEFNEAENAKAVARCLGTDHTELYIDDRDALAIVPTLPCMYDEPFADSSQIPTHIVMKLAKAHVTVALSGDGGDELLGGYNRYVQVPAVWHRLRRIPAPIRRGIAHGVGAASDDALNRILTPLAKGFGVGQAGLKIQKLLQKLRHIESIEDFYCALVAEWPRPQAVLVAGEVPDNLLDRRTDWPHANTFVETMMLLDTLTYLPGDILTKVDRAAMAVSLESRTPFLDRDFMQFCWSLPMDLKIRNGQGKWIMREYLRAHLPVDLIDRPKTGFGIPLDVWLRGPLRDWAETLLSVSRLKADGYFVPETVRATWEAHISGKKNYAYRLWSVLMFQAWLDQTQLD
jgi:asparagine synthase (glutamine-hydrolysing)